MGFTQIRNVSLRNQALTLKFRFLSVKSTSFRFYWQVVARSPRTNESSHARSYQPTLARTPAHARAGEPRAASADPARGRLRLGLGGWGVEPFFPSPHPTRQTRARDRYRARENSYTPASPRAGFDFGSGPRARELRERRANNRHKLVREPGLAVRPQGWRAWNDQQDWTWLRVVEFKRRSKP